MEQMMKVKHARRALGTLLAIHGVVVSGCAGTLHIPAGRAIISDDGVFVSFLDTLIDISDERIFIESPRVNIDIQGGAAG